ncbi:4,5:9,10-diseco-3-hydroxy-5,9, 17-trioxoandrosta-1(10),2-diene-4-oate hydrolase [Dyadobacter sp. CECT 9275]|uniref:4,5:9,10-diseco-3-hydroxy-5,9, 17-trioxoandrosta-1(10),2-diene-4-oate hydrolase n=1 Tax=Dyadobacter helix TaxID=2822344 RepID=A0A916NBH7_9BACT|nr:alpha/beta hydrolase [Dyadobacter sp. CECT 9275]CAG4998094.1 4,5:9,10-diseco-3-hydroxy-5,9, 17-trioxoandrosta-1(10),2-diene-4-oate hydrolase [Dyadobacter sp. CECT 9275]
MKRLIILSGILISMVSGVLAQQDTLRRLDINLENYPYPFPVSYLDIQSQGQKIRMAYMDVQPAAPNDRIIFLLHGKNFNGAYWEETAKYLSKLGFRVVIPDQIGFGKSSKPAHYQYSFHLLASNTKLILDHLNLKSVIVLGHSMGGMVAARFTLMYPEMVSRLILENPIGLEDYKLKVPFQSVDKWYQTELKADFNSIKKYQLTSYYDNKWKPEYDQWVNLLAGWTLNKKDYPRIAWNSALTYDMIYTQPVCYEFEKIRTSTLLIIGQRDRSAVGKNLAPESVRSSLGDYPALGKLTQSKIKNSELAELDNIGHLPHIENFEKFIAPLIKFLEK